MLYGIVLGNSKKGNIPRSLHEKKLQSVDKKVEYKVQEIYSKTGLCTA